MEFALQTFRAGDLLSVFFLVLLEGALSADNALVLAMMVRHLEKKDQKKALLYGLGGAFVFRLVAILLASFVLRLWWLQGLGAAYLLILPIKHLMSREQVDASRPKKLGAGFWRTVIAVEMTDIAFAIDSVLAGVGFVNNRQDKIWVVYFGALIGIILLRFAAAMIIRLLDRYPFLDKVAYALVFWVGVKLGWLAFSNYTELYWRHPAGEMPTLLFWGVLAGIALIGTIVALRQPDIEPPDEDCEAAQDMFRLRPPDRAPKQE